jgi:hypothetical protein
MSLGGIDFALRRHGCFSCSFCLHVGIKRQGVSMKIAIASDFL